MLIENGRDGRYVPTGHLVYALDDVVLAVPFALDDLQVTGSAIPLVTDVGGAEIGASAEFAIALNGSLVYIPDQGVSGAAGGTLGWVTRDGTWTPLFEGDSFDDARSPRLSNDGSRVAYIGGVAGGELDIWVRDLEGGSETRITTSAGFDLYPVWSPDDARLLFASYRTGAWGLFARPSDGSGEAELMGADTIQDLPPQVPGPPRKSFTPWTTGATLVSTSCRLVWAARYPRFSQPNSRSVRHCCLVIVGGLSTSPIGPGKTESTSSRFQKGAVRFRSQQEEEQNPSGHTMAASCTTAMAVGCWWLT